MVWYLCLFTLVSGLQVGQNSRNLGVEPSFTNTIREEGCIPGYYGVQCHLECKSSNCVPHANGPTDIGVTCEKSSGSVTSCDKCNSGRWGISCMKKCPNTDQCDLAYPFHCDKDYGNNLVCSKCREGWTGQSCNIQMTCPPLGYVQHGSMNCDPEKAERWNATCAFLCEPGYKLTGSVATHCVAGLPGSALGEWTKEMPTCEPLSCLPHNIDGAAACIGQTNDLCTPVPQPGRICVGAMKCEGQEGLDTSLFVPVSQAPACPPLSECGQCDDHAVCRVVGGRTACVCEMGYFGSGAINGCVRCSTCDEGFEVGKTCGFAGRNLTRITAPSSHDTVCEDVDECRHNCAPGQIAGCNQCEQICINLPGSYGCACNDGYRLSADGYNCDPITCTLQHLAFSRKGCAGVSGATCDATQAGFCAAGYFGRGSLTCDETGSWVGEASCEPLLCTATNVANIDVHQPCEESSLPWDATFRMPFGKSCSLRCAEGYTATGQLECTTVDGVVRFAPSAQCAPATCPDFFVHVDETIQLKCSGIRTDEPCIGGIDFTCPTGFVARGKATCLSSGRFDINQQDHPRCEPLSIDPCLTTSCPHGKCQIDQYDIKGFCVDETPNRSPFTPSYEPFGMYACPPPSVVSQDASECTAPVGFKEISLGSKTASSLMIGQHVISKKWKPTDVTCSRVPYNDNFIWDEDVPIKVIASVQHLNGRVDGPALSNNDNPAITHWVENTTTSYFTVCFSEVFPTDLPHESVIVNFMAYNYLDGVSYGTSLFSQKRYTGSNKGDVQKYVRLNRHKTSPLVLTTLSYDVTEDGLCDPVHCKCEMSTHNAAVVNTGRVFTDAFNVNYHEFDKYHKRGWADLEQVVAEMYCGKASCGLCDNYESCSHSLQSHMSQHQNSTCYNGRDAMFNWVAFEDVQSFAVRSGTTGLPYQKIGPAFWRLARNCYTVEFGTELKNPIVFVSLNHRDGADMGSFEPKSALPATVHLEGVSSSAFRVCYRLLVHTYEEQPQSQADYVHVDWLVFHEG